MAVRVIDEANRCLNCKKPLCQEGCPIRTPVPRMIQASENGQLNDAAEMVFENNPMSVICSLMCNHENQYEGHCVLGKKGWPVHINSIENHISNTCLDKVRIECEPKNEKKVAVVGAGPANIAITTMLTKKEYSMTIFDAKDQIGGVLRYGILESHLPRTALDRYKEKLLEIGIKIRPNTAIGTALKIKDLLRDGYGSIFIGTGVQKLKALGVGGESLGDVHFAIDYLANPDSYDLGKRVAIIGMGSFAVDVAGIALRRGATEVTLYARGPTGNVSVHEASYAKLDGARMEFVKQIVKVADDGLVFRDVYYDEEGNKTGIFEEVEQVYADSTTISVSQGPKSKLVSTTDGLKASGSGPLMTNQYGETTHPDIFAAGDVVLGTKTVVEATAYSKVVAEAVDEYMKQKDNQ